MFQTQESGPMGGLFNFRIAERLQVAKIQNGHETALDFVSGATFVCVLHHFSGPARSEGSRGQVRPKICQKPKTKIVISTPRRPILGRNGEEGEILPDCFQVASRQPVDGTGSETLRPQPRLTLC